MLGRILAFAIIFVGGWNFALPVAEPGLVPVWFTPVMPVPRLFLHEVLLLLYLGLAAVQGRLGWLRPKGHGKAIFGMMLALVVLGVLSNLANDQPLREMGEAGRLLLLSVYFLALLRWAGRYGPEFVLRALLVGIAAGGAVNIVYSYRVQFAELAGLPWLLGQNGPGGYLGLSVVLSAWLMRMARSKLDRIVALVSLAIGVFATTISFSKLALLMGACGLVAWSAALVSLGFARRGRRALVVLLLIAAAVVTFNPDRAAGFLRSASLFASYKLSDGLIASKDEGRVAYFIGVGEILAEHPVFGVGYAGFYESFSRTTAGKANLTEESKEAGEAGASNPHSAFLYYASANGVPGLLLTIGLFTAVARVLHLALGRGIGAHVVWMAMVSAYLVNGLTLPTLFNTQVMYLPAAVACTVVAARKRARLAGRTRVSPESDGNARATLDVTPAPAALLRAP